MKISYNWLKEFIKIDLDAKILAERLTLSGLELDGMHSTSEGDTIFDIEVTSNRGDCLSHLGVSREISAFSNNEVILPNRLLATPQELENGLVAIESPDICHRFTARVINNVKVGPSPEWLKIRLESIGERSINNIADITNLVMHELGQPMHAFDLDKLNENRIVVRRAKNGEKITTLDEIERNLDDSMMVICDADKPIAIGGIMGGIDSSISVTTTNVLLEVAYFDRESIRQTSRKLGLSSEASYHFERGVDIENLINASNRASQLICDLAEGIAGDFAENYPTKYSPVTVTSNDLKSEVVRISGLLIEQLEIDRILLALGFGKISDNDWIVPSWRHDISIDEDLVEEIIRVYGYDKIESELPPVLSAGEYQPTEMRKRRLREKLADIGFDEALTYSFIDTKTDESFFSIASVTDSKSIESYVTINDPIIAGASRMRPTLIPGLLDSLRTNLNQQNKNISLFEIGRVFGNSNQNELPIERELIGYVMSGNVKYANRSLNDRRFDFYDLKGAVEATESAIASRKFDFRIAEVPYLQSGQTAEIFLGEISVGFIGKLDEALQRSLKIKQEVFVGEIDLSTILENGETPATYSPLDTYPAVSRDVSFKMKRDMTFEKVSKVANENSPDILRAVEFVDLFEGAELDSDEISMTIRLIYRSPIRTLTEDEVEEVHQPLVKNLLTNLNITQR